MSEKKVSKKKAPKKAAVKKVVADSAEVVKARNIYKSTANFPKSRNALVR